MGVSRVVVRMQGYTISLLISTYSMKLTKTIDLASEAYDGAVCDIDTPAYCGFGILSRRCIGFLTIMT